MKIKLRAKMFSFRRWLSNRLATRESIKLRTKLVFALVIFALSFATKSLQAVDIAHVMYTVEQPFSGLTVTHDRRAVSILQGEGILGPYNLEPSNHTWVGRAPGYSIYLSAIYRVVGRDFFRVQTVQNALNSLSPVLIFLIAGLVISWRVGAVSAVLAAISHHLSHISNFILPDSLSALPLLAGIYSLVLARRTRAGAYWLYALAGAMIGVSAWLRAQALVMALFLIVILAIVSGRRWPAIKGAAVMALACALVIAPITIRNYVLYGEFIPIHIGLGVNLWEGIGEASGDRFGAVKTDREVAEQEAIIYNNPRYAEGNYNWDGIQRDRERVRKSLEIIRSHPFWYAGVMVGRMGEMLKYSAHAPLVFRSAEVRGRAPAAPVRPEWREIVSSGGALAFGESIFWLRPLLRPLQRLTKEAMLAFVLTGATIMMVASWRRALFLLGVPLYYLLFQSFMHTEFRFALPMHYFLFTFAAVVWVLIATAIRDALPRPRDKERREAAEIGR